MIVKHIKYYRYEIPLLTPLIINNVKTAKRTGIIIRLKDVDQNTGFGEIAPLPGLHIENLETVLQLLDEIDIHVAGTSISEDNVTSGIDLSEILKIKSLPPSVRFGVSMAVLDLLANSKKIPLNKLYQIPFHKKVIINGLLTGSPDEMLKTAKKLLALDYTTLKIKVGKQPVDDDISFIKKVREIAGEKIRIRLDANRAWTKSEALYFAGKIANIHVEYLEEPLKNPDELPEFSKQSGLPMALDESLSRFFTPDGSLPVWVNAVILKPSIIGDINMTIQIIRQAKKQNIVPVISSAFESGLTLKMLAFLSSVFIPKGTAVGLDTYKWLSQDLLTKPFKASQGNIDVKRLAKRHINLQSPVISPLKR
ncbi:o-succinylbenzoate synthase [candidate division KSB1 bacterium]|nr:o-succinylbenzoate synthase [candidate division KSB1 bacterium]